MEAEFVNVYIQKQKSWIEDLVAKNIMLETKVQLAENKAAILNDQVQQLNSKLEKFEKSKKKVDSSDNTF